MNAEFSTFLHRQICKIEVLNDALPSPAEDYNAVHTFHTLFNMPDGYIVQYEQERGVVYKCLENCTLVA